MGRWGIQNLTIILKNLIIMKKGYKNYLETIKNLNCKEIKDIYLEMTEKIKYNYSKK